MTPETIVAIVAEAVAILAGFVGLVAWIVRLEGRVNNAQSLIALVRESQSTMADFAKNLAVIQTQIVHLQAGSESVHVILERLAGIEGQLKAFGSVLAVDPLAKD